MPPVSKTFEHIFQDVAEEIRTKDGIRHHVKHLKPEFNSFQWTHFKKPRLVGSPYPQHWGSIHPLYQMKDHGVAMRIFEIARMVERDDIISGAMAAFVASREKSTTFQLAQKAMEIKAQQAELTVKNSAAKAAASKKVLRLTGGIAAGTIGVTSIASGIAVAASPDLRAKLRQSSRMVKVRISD
ncbi:hypothetical protein FRB93_003690 [Tulasnella sp. JGI-2019a]|nr:hypothetical protein FRB93_003690 [Tulasnella sp. JGI-2019a]